MVLSLLKNGKDFVTRKQETIISAALVIMVATFATKLLGFLKLELLAYGFGTTRIMDIFYAANTVPEILFNLLIVGSLNTALVPILVECLGKGDSKKFSEVFSSVLNVACIILFILGIGGIIFAQEVVNLLVHSSITHPSIPFTQVDLNLMANMVRVLFISPIILGVSFMVSGVLIVHKRFLITQLASVLYTLGFIIGMVIFYPIMGYIGLCWGVVLGSILHLLIQLPVLKFLNIEYKFVINLKEVLVKKIGLLVLPRLVGLAGEQFGMLVNTVLALSLQVGSLAAFEYAYTFYIFPVSLIGWSFAQAAFPALAEEYNSGKMESFKKTFIKSFQQILYLALPLTIIFIILRLPIVRILGLGGGTHLAWDGTIVIAWILLFFGGSIIIQSVLSLLIRGFYAMQDSKTPVKATLIGLVLNIFLSLYLVQVFSRFDDAYKVSNIFRLENYNIAPVGSSWMAVGGLAAASTISALVMMVILFIVFAKKINGLGKTEFWIPLVKKLIATLIMAGVMYAFYKALETVLNTSKTLELFFLLGIVCYVGITIYVIITFLLNDDEVEFVIKLATKLKRIFYKKENIPSPMTVESPIFPSN